MENYGSLIKNHEFIKILVEIIDNYNECENIVMVNNQVYFDELRRQHNILLLINESIKTNPENFSYNKLENNLNNIISLKTFTESFLTDQSENILLEMRKCIDDIYDDFIPYLRMNIEVFDKISMYYIRQSEKYIEELQMTFNHLKNLMDKANLDFTNNYDKVKNLLNDLKNETSSTFKDIKDKQNNLQQSITEELEKIKVNVIENREEYKSNCENLLTKYDQYIKEKNEECSNFINNSKQKVENLIDENSKKLDEYKLKVEEIVGDMNTSVFSYKYKQVADDAKKRNLYWNIAVGITVIIVLFMAWITFNSLNESINNWPLLIVRFFMIVIGLTFAAYAAKQADLQGKVERYARKNEMEVVAFDLFVKNMHPDTQGELKKEVVRRIFGRENIIEENLASADNFNVINQLKEMLESFKNKQ